MAEVTLSPPPRRSCEESLAFRATVSPPELRRILPKPALPPLAGPTPAAQLRELLTQLDSPRPVYRRIGETALANGEPHEIAQAIRTVQNEIDYCATQQRKLSDRFPLLYPKPAA
jgi:hypothetical protein